MKSLNPTLALAAILASGGSAPGLDVREAAAEIDRLLAADWQRHGLQPNPPADDATFVRRIYLDIVGRIPTLDEARSFLDNTGSDRRAGLIERLLASEGHVQHMFHFWADLLRIQSRANGAQGDMTSQPYLEHVRKRLRENQPYDRFVRELLTARGKAWDNPAIGYYMRDIGMPLDNLANTARIFLGTRLECAQCHNHPFDKWTQMQFYHLAAFTYPLETNFTGIAAQDGANELRRQADRARENRLKTGTETERAQARQEGANARWIGRVFENLGDFVRYSKVEALPTRRLTLPHDYAYTDAKPHDPVAPATIFGPQVNCAPTGDTVRVFADWLTSPENPRFTTVIANRMWKRAFGLGLIEPVDEMFDGTAAANPALLKHLERTMISCGYDLRTFLRALFLTQAYQRQVTRAEILPGETYRFTGPVLRRMSAEQIWDSFVTLIHPTPDLPRRRGIDAAMAARLLYRGKLSDALDLLSAREIYDGAMTASRAYEAIAVRSRQLQEEYAAAQKAKDKARIEKLSGEIRALEFTARSAINDHVVVPAVARLYTRKTGQPAPPPPATPPPPFGDSAAIRKAIQQRPYIDVPGYQPDETIPREEAAAEAARTAVFREEASRLRIPAEDLTRYLDTRRNQAREWPRAADLESPAPRGHPLREFGQSDRDTIENANSEASMQQVLVLMNGSLFDQIMQPSSQLRRNLAADGDPARQLEIACLTLLTRPPTPSEQSAWQRARESGLTDIDDLVHALINTQQFLFIQ